MVPEPIVPDPAEASNSMNRALPLAVIAMAKFAAQADKYHVMTPRLSAPIVYVPVNACAIRAAPVPTPFVSSSPLVRLPAPSAVNVPTAAEIEETVPFALSPVKVKAQLPLSAGLLFAAAGALGVGAAGAPHESEHPADIAVAAQPAPHVMKKSNPKHTISRTFR